MSDDDKAGHITDNVVEWLPCPVCVAYHAAGAKDLRIGICYICHDKMMIPVVDNTNPSRLKERHPC